MDDHILSAYRIKAIMDPLVTGSHLLFKITIELYLINGYFLKLKIYVWNLLELFFYICLKLVMVIVLKFFELKT